MRFFLTLLFSFSACGMALAQAPECPPPPGHIVIESGSYSSQPGVTFTLKKFSAELVPKGHTAPFCYDKYMVVSHAEIFASDETLTNVFAAKLKQAHSKLKDFKVQNAADQATITGTITKVIPLKFTVTGPVDTDGKIITLHARSIKTDGLPVKDLLALFGKNLSSVMSIKNVRGVKLDKNTVSFDPEKLADLKGHIESVTTTDKGLELRYDPVHSHEKHESHENNDAPADHDPKH